MPAAHAEPAPPDEPPGEARSSHGLKVRPRSGLSVVARIENSGVFVRPITMAPALRKFIASGNLIISDCSFADCPLVQRQRDRVEMRVRRLGPVDGRRDCLARFELLVVHLSGDFSSTHLPEFGHG
jgi:hypothetical protein